MSTQQTDAGSPPKFKPDARSEPKPAALKKVDGAHLAPEVDPASANPAQYRGVSLAAGEKVARHHFVEKECTVTPS